MKYILFKQQFDKKLVEAIQAKNSKMVKTLIESLKSEKPISDLYYMLSSIYRPDVEVLGENSNEYLNNIKVLANQLKGDLNKYDSFFDKFINKEENNVSDLDCAINSVLFETLTPYNVAEKTKNFLLIESHIKDYVDKHTEKQKLLNKKEELKEAIDKLSEPQRKIYERFSLTENKEVEFIKFKDETVNYLLEHVEEYDGVKDAIIKINRIKYDPSTYAKDVVELLNLTTEDND